MGTVERRSCRLPREIQSAAWYHLVLYVYYYSSIVVAVYVYYYAAMLLVSQAPKFHAWNLPLWKFLLSTLFSLSPFKGSPIPHCCAKEKERFLLTLGTVFAYPAREALARPVDRIAGPVVCALALFDTVLPVSSAWAHCRNARSTKSKTHVEPRQSLSQA